MNCNKYVIHWENIETIINSAYAAETLALRKTLNKNIYLMHYPSRQRQMKTFQVQAYIQQWFHKE